MKSIPVICGTAALRANLTVRNYGFFADGTRYNLLESDPNAISLVAMPALTNPPTIVAYPGSVALAPYTDPYFRGFDNNFPDFLPLQGVGAGVRYQIRPGGRRKISLR